MPIEIALPQLVVEDCIADIETHYPLESGGVFMGFWVTPTNVIVTGAIGGGTKALRTRRSYEPDTDWQQARIAEFYAASARRETYLGDWHSHPNTKVAQLSWDDKVVMRKIIRSPEARTPVPLMFIFSGKPGAWGLWGWAGHMERRRFYGDRLCLTPVDIGLS